MATAETSAAADDASRSRRALVLDVVTIGALHAITCVVARAAGFDHVSDDDFARVTIAQTFAHGPKVDPSGTSWLPFPFWLLGALMTVVGRSLFAARALSILLASLAAVTPYLALHFSGVRRGRALFATAFAFGTPWCIWLGATTVPESFTASLTAAGVIGLTAVRADPRAITASRPKLRAAVLFALAITAASLSRYEPWPIAAVVAIALAARALRWGGKRQRMWLVLLAGLCALGPIVWMGWNAHAHDGPLHFFRRVSSFKRAIGDGATDTFDALILYPGLLFTTRPEIAIPAVFLLPATLRDPAVRRQWGVPLLCVAAQVAFLAVGNARDGAPAHHPERALVGTMVLLALFVADVGLLKLRELARDGRTGAAKIAAAWFAVAWMVSIVRGIDPPGRGPGDDRREQIARGAKLRAEGVNAIVVTPCAFEHFALLAAYGAPEKAELKPRLGIPVDSSCPTVSQGAR